MAKLYNMKGLTYAGETGEPTPDYGSGGGGAAGAIAALAAMGVSIYNTNKTIKANKQLAEYQYSKDLEMWNRSNQYQSPAEQMKRLQEGGLNPNLVYGGGNVSGNAASQMPKYQAPQVQYQYELPLMMIPNMIGQYQDMKIKQAQHDNLKAQRRALEENIRSKWLSNLFASGSFNDRRRSTYYKSIKDRSQGSLAWQLYSGDLDTQGADNPLTKGIGDFQLEYLAGKNKMQAEQMKKIIADTAYKNLQNEWYESNILANWGGKIFGAVNSMFKGARKAAKPGAPQMKGINQRRRDFDETTRRLRDFKY